MTEPLSNLSTAGGAGALPGDDAVAGAGAGDEPTVGTSDVEADKAAAGADADLSAVRRDGDGTPVGDDDVEADIERAQH